MDKTLSAAVRQRNAEIHQAGHADLDYTDEDMGNMAYCPVCGGIFKLINDQPTKVHG